MAVAIDGGLQSVSVLPTIEAYLKARIEDDVIEVVNCGPDAVSDEDPAALWRYYIQLTEIEQAFKELKSDLAIRPIYHQTDERIEAHIFVAFIAYCLQVTLKYRLKALAPGLTPRAALEKLAPMQLLDVRVPTTDGRVLILPRYTQPDADQKLLLSQLKLRLPEQPPPRIQSQPVAVA